MRRKEACCPKKMGIWAGKEGDGRSSQPLVVQICGAKKMGLARKSRKALIFLVEAMGLEPTTSALRTQRSPS